MRIAITLFTVLVFMPVYAQRAEQIQKIDSLLQPFIQPNSPGFSIGVVENGKLIYTKGIGLANIQTNTPNSESSIFGIASIAKQLTAACIWSLIKENKISLDDDIRKYIPEFPSYGNKILVRHMLNHTSGIRNYHAIMELAGFDYDTEFHDNQAIFNLASKQKALNNIPGEKVIYGNTAYTLLAIIIERITGQNLDTYAKNNLFLPLGMTHTFYRTTSAPTTSNRAVGHIQKKDGSFESVEANQISYGAGSVGSSIEDLAIWSNILNGLNTQYTDLTQFLTTTERLASGELAKYARGTMVDEYNNQQTIHHSGYGLGGQSQIIAVPELKLAVIILTNLESIDPSPLSYQILDVFFTAKNNEPFESAVIFQHDKKELQNFIGQYQEQNSDMKMEILVENDTLKALGSQGKKTIPLTAIAQKKFTRANNSNILYDFGSAISTKADLIVYFGGTPFYFSKAQFIDPTSIKLTDYVGLYTSHELSVDYEIYTENSLLFVNYPNHPKTKLSAGQKDEFGNGQRILYHFERNENNEVIKLFLSAEGTVKNIEFTKN